MRVFHASRMSRPMQTTLFTTRAASGLILLTALTRSAVPFRASSFRAILPCVH